MLRLSLLRAYQAWSGLAEVAARILDASKELRYSCAFAPDHYRTQRASVATTAAQLTAGRVAPESPLPPAVPFLDGCSLGCTPSPAVLGSFTYAMDRQEGAGPAASKRLGLPFFIGVVGSGEEVRDACNPAHVRPRNDCYFRLELELAQAARLDDNLPRLRARSRDAASRRDDDGGDVCERVEPRAAAVAKENRIGQTVGQPAASLEEHVAQLEHQAQPLEYNGTVLAAAPKVVRRRPLSRYASCAKCWEWCR